MTAPTTIADVLTMARLASPAYTDEEMATAETRLAAKAADRIVTGAITFDNATHHLYWRPAPRSGTHPGPEDGDDGIHRADTDLRALCHLVISQPDALSAMSTFIGDRILEPAGARVLACVLHLAGREGSARFWWQYAAGADDVAASYCLYLHHMALGEVEEAVWWQDQVDPIRGRELGSEDDEHYAFAMGWTTCLQVVVRHKAFTDATNAALAYVRNAVRFVDEDVDLPLPDDGFAQRIGEIAAII